jgi:AraC-like DNA-binding protein
MIVFQKWTSVKQSYFILNHSFVFFASVMASITTKFSNFAFKMNMSEFIPSELLKPFIRAYQIIESSDGAVNRVLPNTSISIAFRFRGQVNFVAGDNLIKVPTSAISGLRKSVRMIQYLKGTSTFIVLFKATGAAAFFKEPVNELFEESVSLDNFLGKQQISIIEERLAEAENHMQRVAIIEQFLSAKLSRPNPDRLILAALQKIHCEKGNLKIRQLADTLFISNDAFEKRFRKIVGTTPKQYSSIVRMKSIVDQKPSGQSISAIAFESGYFDQAHFTKDFKLFTGQTPTDFFRSPSFW